MDWTTFIQLTFAAFAMVSAGGAGAILAWRVFAFSDKGRLNAEVGYVTVNDRLTEIMARQSEDLHAAHDRNLALAHTLTSVVRQPANQTIPSVSSDDGRGVPIVDGMKTDDPDTLGDFDRELKRNERLRSQVETAQNDGVMLVDSDEL